MRTVEIIAAIIAAILLYPTNAHAASDWTACSEGNPGNRHCVWDARHMGNGAGRSYLKQWDGDKVWITHARAHRLLAK